MEKIFPRYFHSIYRSIYIEEKRRKMRDREDSSSECLFCKLLDEVPSEENLVLYKDDLIGILVNKYPYNPGHLLVVTRRHREDILELSDEEYRALNEAIRECVKILREVYSPDGFNIGLNLGEVAGASIKHFHYHVVPRFSSELGFMDVIGGTRIVVETPEIIYRKLRDRFRALGGLI